MSELRTQINEDFKTFMREKNTVALNVVKMLRSDIKYAEVAKSADYVCSDEEIIKIVVSSIKKRKDSAEQYKNANREDLCENELAEIKVLEKYLPAQLDEAAIKSIISKKAAEMGIAEGSDDGKAIGTLMKAVMQDVGSSAEGRVVNNLVSQFVKKS